MSQVSVIVAARVRPQSDKEKERGERIIVSMEKGKTTIFNPKTKTSSTFNIQYSFWSCDGAKKDEQGDCIAADADSKYVSQQMVYDTLGSDLINSAFNAENSCLFCYGQTGSGKSYTIMGGSKDKDHPNANLGIVPRICKGMFERISTEKKAHPKTMFGLQLALIEIYNEQIRNLLGTSNAKDTHGLTLLSRRVKNNDVFSLEVNLVDLAGSEKTSDKTSNLVSYTEGVNINKSLLTLGNVIDSLVKSMKHASTYIPYRESVLTKLLKESLGGNSRTVMLTAISPSENDYIQTLSTLKYIMQVRLKRSSHRTWMSPSPPQNVL